jgi:hypothetical protein
MKKILYLFVFLSTALNAQVAVPFWSENFTNGFPTGWVTADPSGNNVTWTWCGDPTAGASLDGCSPIFDDATNEQTPFAAPTASTGFMTLNSDGPGQLPTDHASRLTTSAINCTGKNVVFVKFQNHLGTYTYDADGKAVLRVSTDQTNWIPFQVFFGLTTSERWSANPSTAIIDISSVAANKGTVYLQWEWTGNWEYFWNLDDIEIFGENPTPRHDLAISSFFYPPSSYAQPASELSSDPFGFFAAVSNNGLVAQTKVKLKAWVSNEAGAVLFADSTTINSLPAGFQDSIIELSNLYTPNLPQGTYNIHYSVRADSTDLILSDNLVTSEFKATAAEYAKENAPEQSFRPSGVDAFPSYYVGNYYRTSATSLEKYRATSATFTHTVNEDEIPISEVTATIYLLRVNDNIDDNLTNLDDNGFLNSFKWVGLAEYTTADTTVDDLSLKTISLVDFDSGLEGVELEEGARYVLAIGYAENSKFVFHTFNDDNSYFFTSTLIYTDGFSSFGDDVNAVLRLNLALVTTTDNTPLPEASMQVTPNPATDYVNLNVQLDKAGPATFTIADLSGRVIVSDEQKNVQQGQFTYQLGNIAAGTYLARIATENGTLTKKFTVVK